MKDTDVNGSLNQRAARAAIDTRMQSKHLVRSFFMIILSSPLMNIVLSVILWMGTEECGTFPLIVF